MSLDPAIVLALATQCAPGVSAQTMLALAHAESGLDPFAIGVNGGDRPRVRARTAAEAVALARAHIAAGRDVDLGLAQINVRNLARLGLTLEAAFDPCRNLAASAQVLADGYARGVRRVGSGQAALRIALSYYNTGDAGRGLRNGYVNRVIASARSGRAQRPPPITPDAAASSAVRLRVVSTFVFSPTGATP